MRSDLDRRFFQPDVSYSPKPFWFLNGDLNEAELTRQLEDFKAHGVMGAILHPRIGIPKTLTYMSPRFLELIAHAVKECERLGMLAVLYDEGMYPSGSACGQVVAENPRFASRGIRLMAGEVQLTGDMRLIARCAVTMDGDACTASRVLAAAEQPLPGESLYSLVEDYTGGTIRGIHDDQEDGMPGAPASTDILNAEAVQCFIRLTHDKYYQALAPYFGNVIQGMFVDEPGPLGRNAPRDMRAWTYGLEEELADVGLTPADLPLLWLPAAHAEQVRKAYTQLITLRLSRVFYAPIQQWCHAHGIALTGHPQHAGDIGVEKYFDIPGQDLVWRWVAPENGLALYGEESTQAMCAYSAALHSGKRRVSSECFGCCGPQGDQWSFSVDDMLFYLNWLFARGTNMIYPHAFLYACDTQVRFGDRPPDVGPNNIWWPWYGRIARYISSTCSLLDWGQADVSAAILCADNDLPWNAAAVLFQHQVAFAYLPVSVLRSEASLQNGSLCVGGHAYRTIICEDSALLNDPAVNDLLQKLQAQGGSLVICGEQHPGSIPMEALSGLPALACLRSVVLTGTGAENIRCLTRREGDVQLFYLANEGETPWEGDADLLLRGACTCYDPWNGTATPWPIAGSTVHLRLDRREALFLAVDSAATPGPAAPAPKPAWQEQPLALDWRAVCERGSFDHVQPGDWQQWPGMALYSGEVTYTARFTLSAAPAHALLELGQVRDLAVVTLNGTEADALLRSPFRCRADGMLRAGDNVLTVRVRSCLTSHYDHKPCPGGLLGPVKLYLG